MKKEYDEIMEHIKVTPEMRRRILRHIQEENIPASSSKIVKYPSIPKYLSVAACLVLLLVGALALPRMVNGGDLDPIASSGQGLEEVASRHDLSDLVGFALDDELKLPFHVDDIRFFSYWGNLPRSNTVARSSLLTSESPLEARITPAITQYMKM